MFLCSVFGRIHLPFCRHLDGRWWFSCLACCVGFIFCLALLLMPCTLTLRSLISFLLFSCPYSANIWFIDFYLRTYLFEVEWHSFYLCLFSHLLFFSVHLAHILLPCSSQDHPPVLQVHRRILLISCVLEKGLSWAFSPLKSPLGRFLSDTAISCSHFISSFFFLSHNFSLGDEIKTIAHALESFSFLSGRHPPVSM